MPGPSTEEGSRVGRYRLFDAIARGGMARVHLARLDGDAGFSRVVAIKRLHAHLLADASFVAMFRDEARLVARIRHPNVVPILDVVSLTDELFLVMEYVLGESLAQLFRRCTRAEQRMPPEVVVSIACGMLAGLHAAHEATNEHGEPLGIVHRDVSPQNVIVGEDGFARVLDFGVAYAAERLQPTTSQGVKGKLEYMSLEQITGGRVDRRTDVYAAGIVIWEALTGKRLFKGENDGHTLSLVKEGASVAPSAIVPSLPTPLDSVVMRALSTDPDARPATALELATALSEALTPAPTERVAQWLSEIAGESLTQRRERLRQIEAISLEVETEPSTAVEPPAASVPDSLLASAASDPFAARASLLSIPPPAPPPRTWPRTLLLTGLVAGCLIGAAWYVIRTVRSDFDRALSNDPVEQRGPAELPERLRTRRARSLPTESAALPLLPAPSASASTAKAKPKAPSPVTPESRLKALRAHCNPPYVILGNGQKVKKVACE